MTEIAIPLDAGRSGVTLRNRTPFFLSRTRTAILFLSFARDEIFAIVREFLGYARVCVCIKSAASRLIKLLKRRDDTLKKQTYCVEEGII